MGDEIPHRQGFSVTPIRSRDLVVFPQLQVLNWALQAEIASLQAQVRATQAQSLTPVTSIAASQFLAFDTSQTPAPILTLDSDRPVFVTTTQVLYADQRLGIQGSNNVSLPGHVDARICHAFGDDANWNVVYVSFLDSDEELIEAISYGLEWSESVDAFALHDQGKGMWISQGPTLNYFPIQESDSSKALTLPLGSSYVVSMVMSGERLFILDDNFALFAYDGSIVCLLAGGPGNSGSDASKIQILVSGDRLLLRLAETSYSEYSLLALMQNPTVPGAFTTSV